MLLVVLLPPKGALCVGKVRAEPVLALIDNHSSAAADWQDGPSVAAEW